MISHYKNKIIHFRVSVQSILILITVYLFLFCLYSVQLDATKNSIRPLAFGDPGVSGPSAGLFKNYVRSSTSRRAPRFFNYLHMNHIVLTGVLLAQNIHKKADHKLRVLSICPVVICPFVRSSKNGTRDISEVVLVRMALLRLMDQSYSVLPLRLPKLGNLTSCGGKKKPPSLLFWRARVPQLVCDWPAMLDLQLARPSPFRLARPDSWKTLRITTITTVTNTFHC